ncbi:hypothetical protein [Motilimonas pumila]|uniref:Uncharacterized protein n=1 Tax=Motilimonas pumila TaxID=2303987 RepID=A0A418YBQ8_9GAMM|nr:hypothetical protein [Motilimonas pumila]RJG41921.1 hypothetical protein D1Z90_15625 [Motilimonas pumila]
MNMNKRQALELINNIVGYKQVMVKIDGQLTSFALDDDLSAYKFEQLLNSQQNAQVLLSYRSAGQVTVSGLHIHNDDIDELAPMELANTLTQAGLYHKDMSYHRLTALH